MGRSIPGNAIESVQKEFLEPTTIEEYLEFERRSDARHEFVNGEIFAAEDSSRRHSLIVTNLVYRLGGAARTRRCEVHSSAVKLQAAASVVYYPDVMVVCDPDDTDELIVTKPCLVVEVISPSSQRIDRQEKLLFYREIESLETYLIVFQDERRVIQHRRSEDGSWRRAELIGTATLVPCLSTEITLDQIYEGVD